MNVSNLRTMFNDLPRCRKCNDHGYWTIIYQTGYDTIRPCDCTAAYERWGESTFEEMNNRPENLYWDDMRMYFGGNTKAETQEIMRKYRLVTMEQHSPRSEIVKKYVKEDER